MYYYLQSVGCLSMGAVSITLACTFKEVSKIRHQNLHIHKYPERKNLAQLEQKKNNKIKYIHMVATEKLNVLCSL